MSKKLSPNRRRSIAVLGHGPSKTSSRRRAYSIAPGERLSPAAKARRLLAPRKSILKGSINIPRATDTAESSTSAGQDETSNITQNMDLTEVHGVGPRRSLARRVSFAPHTHVRLYHKPSPDSQSRNDSSPVQPNPKPAFITRAENDENAIPGPSHLQRRTSFRRRSSCAYSEFGERSMDMDSDDTAPLPQDFLSYNRGMAAGSALDDDEFTEDEDDTSDMEVTEAIARNIERKRSLSLGGNRTFLGTEQSRASVVTRTQFQTENQPPRRDQIMLEGDSFEHDGEEEPTTSSAHTGSSFTSEGSSGEPMEFTIPVLPSMRQPREPDPVWLQLRAMTHAGDEPYELPPPESDDDAVMIQPSPGHAAYALRNNGNSPNEGDDSGEQDMDLTSAMSRLQQARASLGLGAPTVRQEGNSSSGEDQGVEQGERQQPQDETFSTEDSFADQSADLDNRTINWTQRASLAALGSPMDETEVQDGVIKVLITPGMTRQLSPPAPPLTESTQPPGTIEPSISVRSLSGSIFSAPPTGSIGPNVFGVPVMESSSSSVFAPPASEAASSNVFTPPSSGTAVSSIFSAPVNAAATAPKAIGNRPRSPSKSPGLATIPKPFTLNLPRAGSPSKIPTPSTNGAPSHPYRGTAAFAPPTVPKSPKRPAPELPGAEADGPSSAKRPAMGRPSTGRTVDLDHPSTGATSSASDEQTEPASQSTQALTANRRASMVRRPAGYFTQRKSLGTGVLPRQTFVDADSAPPEGAAKLRPRASMGSQPTNVGVAPPLTRTQSDPGPTDHASVTEGSPLYPDLTRLTGKVPVERATSPANAAERGKGKDCTREAARQAIAVPSPTRGSPAPAPLRAAAPAPAQRVASPVPGTGLSRDRPVTHIEKPLSAQPRIIDVSMAMDVEADASAVEGYAGVSQAWRESVPEEPPQEDDGPPISIEQFFQMTGIRFMDELTMPKPRRSTALPGQLRPRGRRRSSSIAGDLAVSSKSAGGEDEEAIPLAEFAVAMAVDMPRLDLYAAVARDLTAYIQECKKIYREAEEEALKVTPSLFREFASVDETEQAMLIHQLKLIKANNIGTAKSQWYDWKLQWVEQLYETAAQGFANLELDATYLADIIKEAQDILPALREEYAEVTRLLEQEQADIDEIENSDKDYLNELKATIAEQSTEIEAFRADVSEAKAKLERLDEKLAEIEVQKQEVMTAIAQAKHVIHIQKESTSAEVFRLKDELEALHDLHLWRPVKHTADLIEFIYASKYHVSLPCRNYKPILAQATIVRTKHSKLKERDAFPQFTDLMLKTARNLIGECDEKLEIKQVLERLGDFWASCAQLRSQLTFLSIKYPLTIEALMDNANQPYLRATATVMFPSLKGKAFISFLMDRVTYSQWPLSAAALKSDVQIAYGSLKRETVMNAVLGRLAQVTPADSHGCLLDACIEATELFEQ
ncbi:Spc7 kinetochore protein-domain-containing protein [Trametes punicea]|nr:Spc7 kinetochore protein-domain-containing protein [Trametes punicea]